MCLDKKVGGMGAKGLHKLNKALLGKWNWCVANERNSLWRKTTNRKYGELHGGWCSRKNRGNFGTGVRKEIMKDWVTLLGNSRFLIGEGSRVRFWKDF